MIRAITMLVDSTFFLTCCSADGTVCSGVYIVCTACSILTTGLPKEIGFEQSVLAQHYHHLSLLLYSDGFSDSGSFFQT